MATRLLACRHSLNHGIGATVLTMLLALGLSTGPVSLAAQTMEVPVETQIPLFLKLLSFDRNLASRRDSVLLIGVVFQGGNRESQLVREATEDIVRSSLTRLAGVPVQSIAIDLDHESLDVFLRAHRVAVIYVAPLRAVDVRDLARVSRQAQVRSYTGVTRYVNLGLAVGVGLRGDLPQIIINLPAARLEGADFPAQLLRLARVLQ
jgi:hypothetical protein